MEKKKTLTHLRLEMDSMMDAIKSCNHINIQQLFKNISKMSLSQTLKIYYNDINKEYPFFISKLFFSLEIVVRFAVPAKKNGTVGTVPTVPGAMAVNIVASIKF
jgi:hypothetical protein